MSLPTRLYFYKDCEVIGNAFVNVGWFMDGECLAREIINSIVENKNLFEQCDTLVVYELEFTKEEIFQSKSYPEFQQYCKTKLNTPIEVKI